MGYYITQLDSKIFISNENKSKALQAIKTVNRRHYDWLVNNYETFLNAQSLEGGLLDWGYISEYDVIGNIINVQIDKEKMGGEEEIFKAMSPFIEDGSYIEYRGDDGKQWKWIFEKGKMIEKVARLVYDD